MKRVANWLAGIAVCIALVLLALPMFLSSSAVKERVETQLTLLTGKQVHLRGESSVSLWPFLQVSYDDVTIRSGDDEGGLLVQMDGLEAQLSFTSAFWGDADLSHVTIVRPRFTLLRDQDGSANWSNGDGLLARRFGERSQADRAVSLGSVRVIDGIADYEDRQAERTAQLTAINATLNWPSLRGAATLRLDAVWQGEVFELIVNSASPVPLLRGEISETSFEFSSNPVRLSYSGQLGLSSSPDAAGQVSLLIPSPRRLLEWIGHPIPVATVIAETQLEGAITASDGLMEFAEAQIRVGEHSGTGQLELQTSDGEPSLIGTLAFQSLWLPNPMSLAQTSAEPQPSGKLDLSFLEGFGLDLRLSAVGATIGPLNMANLAAAAIVRDGAASFEVGEAEALSGSIAGSISVSKGPGVGLFETDLSFNGVDLDALTTLYGQGPLALSGQGDASLRFRSTGTSAQGLLINLEGDGAIDATEGTLRGFDLARIPLDGSGNAASVFEGNTPFDGLSARFTIDDGFVALDGTSMSSEAIAILLGGQIDLIRRSIALRGEVAQTQTEPLLPSVPFFVGGSMSAPLFIVLPPATRQPVVTE
ncbi:MAG: AsmA family protein [Ahrensia sp.]|nr:AsmA family protein [Ahrensia sp.]